MQVLYTAIATATGGRQGRIRLTSITGLVNVHLNGLPDISPELDTAVLHPCAHTSVARL